MSIHCYFVGKEEKKETPKLSCSVTLEKKGTLSDHFSGAAAQKKKGGGKKGATEQLRKTPQLLEMERTPFTETLSFSVA